MNLNKTFLYKWNLPTIWITLLNIYFLCWISLVKVRGIQLVANITSRWVSSMNACVYGILFIHTEKIEGLKSILHCYHKYKQKGVLMFSYIFKSPIVKSWSGGKLLLISSHNLCCLSGLQVRNNMRLWRNELLVSTDPAKMSLKHMLKSASVIKNIQRS